MTPAQFYLACGADAKWVQNAARLLRWEVRYTTEEARRIGLVKQLQADLRVPLEVADRLAAEALDNAGGDRVLVGSGEIARVVVDLHRYLSDFALRLARAVGHHEPRRRGRRRRGEGGAVARAERHGMDVGLLRASLRLTAAERIRRLDENMEFVRALRGRRR